MEELLKQSSGLMINVCRKIRREEVSLSTELEKYNWSITMGLKRHSSVQPETANLSSRRAHAESNNPFYIVFSAEISNTAESYEDEF